MQEIHCNLPLQSVQLKVESYNKDRGSMMTANRRSVRKRRSKHKGSMKIITLIVLVLCGVFGVFTWQNTQKSEQYALVQENLQQQVEHFGLRSRFDTLLGLSDIYAKSKTEVGLRWLRESGADPARIMMVGDSEHDFEVARALGVRCVLFSGGHQPREVLAATGAPVIDALAQLLPLLAQLAAE